MAKKKLVTQFGLGTSLRHESYTEAAKRAVDVALRRNALTVADAFGVDRNAMIVDILIGATKPDLVDREAVASVAPYGTVNVQVEAGGLDIGKDTNPGVTVMVNAAVTVSLDLDEEASQ